MFEEMIYVLKGRGATSVWLDDGKKQTFEWQERSFFSIPLNAWHQHFNGQGSETVRFIGYTNAPSVFHRRHRETPISRLDQEGARSHQRRVGVLRQHHLGAHHPLSGRSV
jgi:gentisate 1,2-dioxygenase